VDPGTGRTYYVNVATKATSWEVPTEGGAPVRGKECVLGVIELGQRRKGAASASRP
jgi:hypothetical protein